MKRVFADTSYFLALLSPRDQYREVATGWAKSVSQRVVTSEYVLLEVGNALSTIPLRSVFIKFLSSLIEDPTVTIVPGSIALFEKAVDLFQIRVDKDWSLTDCTSFVIMTELQIELALTFDRHFEQAGFVLPLRD